MADFFLCPSSLTTVLQLSLCLQCVEDILSCDMHNILCMSPPDLGFIYWEKVPKNITDICKSKSFSLNPNSGLYALLTPHHPR